MADETVSQVEQGPGDAGGEVDNYEQLQNDLEEEIVNNDGSPLEPDETEQTQDGEKQKPVEAPESSATKGDETGEADKPPEGYLSSFFKTGEDGAVSFDVEGFAKEVAGDAKQTFRYGDREYLPAPQQADGKDDADPDEMYFREERDYRKSLEGNLLRYRAEFSKSLQQLGYAIPQQVLQADEMARRAIDAMLREHYEERDLRRRAEERKSQRQQTEEVHKETTTKTKYEANLTKVISAVGGQDKWSGLVTQGVDVVNFLFDLANPDFKGTRDEANAAIGKWFSRFGANDKNLGMLVQLLKGKAALGALPFVYKRGMAAKAKTQGQNRTTHSRQMGGRGGSRAPKADSERLDDIDRFLNPVGEDEVLDIV